jgi:hypothetical protein
MGQHAGGPNPVTEGKPYPLNFPLLTHGALRGANIGVADPLRGAHIGVEVVTRISPRCFHWPLEPARDLTRRCRVA